MDETYTSFRVSGYTEVEVDRLISTGEVLGIEDLQKYQHLNSEKTVFDTVKGLAQEEPQLSPLYFIMARYWAELFGDSIASMRSLAAFISLFAFPCMYWLCLELFQSSLTGWIAIALTAVSPFHLVYAQEARPYSLWIVITLLSCATLLRAMRVKTKISWGIYALTVAVGFYTYLFFAFVAIAQGIYVVINEGLKGFKTIKSYVRASFLGVLAFSPWIATILYYLPQIFRATPEQNQQVRQPLGSLIKNWIGNISRGFLDLGVRTEEFNELPKIYYLATVVSVICIVSFVAYSIYFLYRHSSKRVWLLAIALMGVASISLILPDLIIGGKRSTMPRYLVTCHIGVQLAVAYLISKKLSYNPMKIRQQLVWRLILIILITGGVLSGIANSQADLWWQKRTNTYNPELAPLINQANNPLVMRDVSLDLPPYNFFTVVSLSYLLKSDVKYQFVFEGKLPNIPQKYNNIFLVEPSDLLLSGLEKRYNVNSKKLFKDSYIWQLKIPT